MKITIIQINQFISLQTKSTLKHTQKLTLKKEQKSMICTKNEKSRGQKLKFARYTVTTPPDHRPVISRKYLSKMDSQFSLNIKIIPYPRKRKGQTEGKEEKL